MQIVRRSNDHLSARCAAEICVPTFPERRLTVQGPESHETCQRQSRSGCLRSPLALGAVHRRQVAVPLRLSRDSKMEFLAYASRLVATP